MSDTSPLKETSVHGSPMGMLSTSLELQILDSQVSDVTPEYWRGVADNQPYGQLYYVEKGNGLIRSFGLEQRLQPGHLYLLPPRANLAYLCSENMRIWWTHFTATLYGHADLFDYFSFEIERKPEDREAVKAQVAMMLRARSSAEPADQLCAMGILIQLLAPFFRAYGDALPDRALKVKQRFIPVLKHIDENLSRSITVAELAHLASYTQSHFSKLFSTLFSLSPKKYILHRRIERVQQELQRSDVKLAALAQDYGFGDAFHLSRTFKRYTGMSPSKFRRRAACSDVPSGPPTVKTPVVNESPIASFHKGAC